MQGIVDNLAVQEELVRISRAYHINSMLNSWTRINSLLLISWILTTTQRRFRMMVSSISSIHTLRINLRDTTSKAYFNRQKNSCLISNLSKVSLMTQTTSYIFICGINCRLSNFFLPFYLSPLHLHMVIVSKDFLNANLIKNLLSH